MIVVINSPLTPIDNYELSSLYKDLFLFKRNYVEEQQSDVKVDSDDHYPLSLQGKTQRILS